MRYVWQLVIGKKVIGKKVIGNWEKGSYYKLTEVSGSKNNRPQCVRSLVILGECDDFELECGGVHGGIFAVFGVRAAGL